MATDYTISWILPFVRESLREHSEFTFDNYIDRLWQVLEKASVPGIVRHQAVRVPYTGTTYDSSQASYQLRYVATEAFFYLIHNGLVMPGPSTNTPGFPQAGRFYLTSRGTAWAANTEPPPEDFNGYMKLLRNLVPNLDAVIVQYVSEGLGALVRSSYFAAAVMVGAAAEKAIYLLAESMVDAFKDATKQAKLKKLLGERRLQSLFLFLEKTIKEAHANKAIPYAVAEGTSPHLISLIEAIRV
jgi:hypothetical protein